MINPKSTITIAAQVVPSEPRLYKEASTVVIIDVLRATTSMVTALTAGATHIYPVADIEEAKRLSVTNKCQVLTAGERQGKRIPGFDLGNSPYEFTPQAVAGKTIIMCTTNGTKALSAYQNHAALIVTAALVNISAAANFVAASAIILLVCAGREGRFALEDSFCAGGLIENLAKNHDVILDDGAIICLEVWKKYHQQPLALLQSSYHGRYLVSLGFGADLEFCAELDRFDTVPIFNGSALILAGGGSNG